MHHSICNSVIHSTDLDAIYYTTDGSTPDNTDTQYTGPISITSTTTLKFIGYDTLGNAGPVGTEVYTIGVTTAGTSLSLRLSTNINIPSALIPSHYRISLIQLQTYL